MKRPILNVLVATWLTLCMTTSTRAEMVINEASIYPASILHELQLMRPLMAETNQAFDESIYRSVRTNSTQALVISYQEISFIFCYPTTNHLYTPSSSKIDNLVVPSSCEMGNPDQLLCTQSSVSHVRLYTNDVPVNYIRLYDPSQTYISADLEILLGISPPKAPQDKRYARRLFRFVYNNGWKEDDSPGLRAAAMQTQLPPNCIDCISRAQMPYRFSDDGTNYILTEHPSIEEMIDNQTEVDSINKHWIERLKKRFADDKDVMTYVKQREGLIQKLQEKWGSADKYLDNLEDIKDNLDQSGGELYYYYILGKKVKMDDGQVGVEEQEGYLILSHGKVFKTYNAGAGLVSEKDLRTAGILPASNK